MTASLPGFDAAARRSEITTDAAQTALEAAARLLIEAYDEYESALDRGARLDELQKLDQQVAEAERAHAAAAARVDA